MIDKLPWGLLAFPLIACLTIVGLSALRGMATGTRAVLRDGSLRRDLLWLLALTGVALGLRALLSPFAPYHGEGAAYSFLNEACRPLLEPRRWPFHGGMGPILYSLANTIFPFAERSVFWLNACLGAASCGLVFLVARALGLSRPAGIIAGVLLAALPGHIRLSGSESYVVSLVFWWSLALWIAARLKQDSPWRSWLLLVAVLVIAANTRPLGALIVPVVVVLLMPTLRQRPWLIGWFLLLAPGLLPPLLQLWPELSSPELLSGRAGEALRLSIFWRVQDNPLLLPQVTPLALHPLVSFLGVLVLARARHWRAMFALALGYVLAALAIQTQAIALINSLRFAAPTALFAAVLSGVAVSGLAERVARARHGYAALLSLFLVGAAAAPWLGDYLRVANQETNLQAEYRFLRESALELPARSLVLMPSGWQRESHYSPTYLSCQGAHLGRDIKVAETDWVDDMALARQRNPGGLYLFLGLACHSFRRGAPALAGIEGRRQPAVDWSTDLGRLFETYRHGVAWKHRIEDERLLEPCRSWRDRKDLSLVAERALDNRPAQWFSVPARRLRFGLYRWDLERSDRP